MQKPESFLMGVSGVVLSTLLLASGFWIAVKICKDCVLGNYETVEKFDNFTKTSRNLEDFEIGPSDDFVYQYS